MRGGAQPLHALVRVRMTAGIDSVAISSKTVTTMSGMVIATTRNGAIAACSPEKPSESNRW